VGCHVIDDYPRRPIFDFYVRNPCPFYAVTFELEATAVRRRARDRERSVYASLVWAFHRAMLQVDAFRVRYQGGALVLYDSLTIGMTVPAPKGTFSFATVAFDPDPDRYFVEAADAMERASRRLDLSGGSAPDFAYYTALPSVPFTAMTHVPLSDPMAGQPMTAFGRIHERDGRALVPVSLQVNHRFVDGADIGVLYESAQESFAAAF